MSVGTDAPARVRATHILGAVMVFASLFYIAFIYRNSFVIGGRQYFTLVDDAMISMRYGRNLANGYGLVWNPGETPVLGVTNLGWTLLMAFLHLLNISETGIPLLVMTISIILLLGNALLAFKIIKDIEPQMEYGPLLAASISAFYYPLVFWSLRGMEVAAITFLVSLSVLFAIRLSKPVKTRTLPFLLGLSILTALVVRLDVLPQVILIMLFTFYFGRVKRNWLSISPILLIFASTIVIILLWQNRYYGSVLPNTYYLKVMGVSMSERLIIGIQTFVEYSTRDFLMPLVIISAGILLFREMRKKEYLLLLALFVVQCVYSVYVGGDYAEPLTEQLVDAANRFITQGMTSIIILFGIACDRFLVALQRSSDWLRRHRSRSALTLTLIISIATLLVISGEPWFKWVTHNSPLLSDDIWRTELGLHRKNNTDESATIAAHAVGQIAYYSERRTIDLLGKSDPVVARGQPVTSFRPGHNKWNYEYSILTLRPDLVADEWGLSSQFLSSVSEYYRLENGIWIQSNSILLNVEGLTEDYRERNDTGRLPTRWRIPKSRRQTN